MSLHRIFILLMIGLAVTVAGHADVFKYYDSSGNLVLTDTLPKDKDKASKVEKVEARPVMTIPAIKGVKAAGADDSSAVKKEAAYVLIIKSPSSEADYQRNSGDLIPVTVTISPKLRPGDRLETLLDGKLSGSELSSLQPADLDRGSHSLLVRIVDNANKILSSSSVTFQVHQTGLLGPAVKPQPKPTPRH